MLTGKAVELFNTSGFEIDDTRAFDVSPGSGNFVFAAPVDGQESPDRHHVNLIFDWFRQFGRMRSSAKGS